MLTDSHCHLDFTCFDRMQGDLISTCLASGISHFINPAVQFYNWHKVIALLLKLLSASACFFMRRDQDVEIKYCLSSRS